ncbi:aldehyde ferredoxin oxidoreductase [Natronomonas pharaonis DSM 2160]|uniref:Aldehyde ferredoxin oxidoreductase n=1 Tax=Natronomonas pharaonis (strain ATCC 35678 / DSM 2160 / CIP 103997 / JCM 8858 / NBRC 14720 / NCIMB 2260 / Gabara) TaxID=348780 RepID=A0A1U7EUX3_NATPD|nr:aldehyde ferredoxin oxidoreductase C-terminal domain-containing protein [Natronomonas pharaonis]CAI48807.1 aldehyde ferredoxin oxidoreductase [Natronomonas pharaonis DSM 2160]
MIHTEGPLLSIDVSDRTASEAAIDDVLESYIGGRGVGTKLAHDRIPFDADPLGPENRLVFATGPLQTSIMSYTGRMSCTGLSPLTDGLLSSNAGGFMSRPFADTGYAAVEIAGASDELVGIHVTDEGVTFESAADLEGATVEETVDHIEAATDLDVEHTAIVGPAGENEVRFASIMTSGSRAFGRGGLGAVLGSKNVKYLTFDGDSRRPVEGIDEELVMDIHSEASESGSPMKDAGTTSVSDYANSVGALPTKYFSELSYDKVDQIGSSAVIEHKYKKGTCSSCAFACKLPTRDEETGLETEGPEFETMMAFGSNALVDDFVAIMKSNELCDQLGLDTISCGDVIAAYLESEDEFGNVDLIHDLIEQIAHRDGIGDTLAEGIDRVHDELGVENWSMKGMEFAAHDGRTLNGQGLGYATSNRGADHMYGEFYHHEYPLVPPAEAVDADGVAGKSEKLVELENKNAIHDSGVLCKFASSNLGPERYARLFDTDWETLQSVGGRIVDLERHFNNQRGFDRADDDDLPYELEGLGEELSAYYDHRGWNDDGTVPNEHVETSFTPADD